MRINFKIFLMPGVLSFLGALIALFPSNPENMTLPSRDSGVFLYMGWRLLNGDVPYRDVWDHKPPLVYFIDAVGLLLSPQSLWGIWLLQFCFIFLTILFLYNALKDSIGIIPAIVGVVVLTSGLLTILDQGNVTEEYALLFQTLCFWLVVRAQKNNYSLRNSFWIGICGASAFYLKQTTIGIWIAYALFLFAIRIIQKKSPFFDLLSLSAGLGLLSIILALGFASQHAFNDYWNEAFIYNFIYIGKHEGIRRLIPVFIKGFLFLSQGAVLYLGLIGWFLGLLYVWLYRRLYIKNIQPLIFLALVDFPLEVALITVSGRSLLHYYLTPLPVIAILGGLLVYALTSIIGTLKTFSSQSVKTTISILSLMGILFFQVNQVLNYPAYIENVSENSYAPVIGYINGHTTPNDKVLILGAESVVNFLTRREAPTRYVYQYPLQLLGSRGMFDEYFQQIIQNKPVLIIDAPGSNQLDENLYKPLQLRSTEVQNGVKYLLQNYQQVATFGDWVVYKLKE